MSLLSDKQIRQLSVPPTCYVGRAPAYNHEPCWLTLGEIEETQRAYSVGDPRRLVIIRPQGMVGSLEEEYRRSGEEIAKTFKPMIEPFSPEQVRYRVKPEFVPEGGFELGAHPEILSNQTEKIISYGLSSYGYDVRCGPEFKVFTNIHSTVVDPKNFDEKSFVDFNEECCIIPPNSFALARTAEYFRIPRDVLVVCLGKSTYARCGIVVNVTPLEPEWEGQVTLEFSNTTPLPAKIYAGEGCAQLLFFRGEEPCEVSYKDRAGKYQGQTGVRTPQM